ncbi:low molecular weight phosphotyrosine protein phosphatase [Aquimarina sp. AD1]|uniref:low molecular weight protein-tyrosine-phosphatase n=1 Tax=Aquimarina sp. (strain AD1) TaxID=1714848 RepID=UPI000E4687DD|nr:low molecular weight protein-tyrosine-phosphatase [Aquimarina sp. AD1]AXT54771.1 low molecular weight phosphotyrosine protein phosphatase [Aquimarina sp. AD1]RKN15932.1 low molecular weight phosphotyrosine protein phosphatase [Aquimarina sp. AD1]
MKVKILMVCLGNICRSPLAEGILASKLDSEKFQVDSSGTSNYHIGEQPDRRSIETARKHGIDITNQRAAQFKVSDFDHYDFIYPMDNSNYQNIIKLSRNEEDRKKVKLILNELQPYQNLDVPDPYYGGDQGFENVYQMLDKACDHIVTKL